MKSWVTSDTWKHQFLNNIRSWQTSGPEQHLVLVNIWTQEILGLRKHRARKNFDPDNIMNKASLGPEPHYRMMVIVMDGEEEVCVDPGEMGAILEAGESGGPAHQEGERTDSWHQTVEEGRRCKMSKSTGDRLTITPSHIYAQSMYHCILCISYCIIIHNRNRVLLCYLFLENKSLGSKKPFAFILWCTGSCVEHSNI
jgi:hypothetical protein